MNFFALFTAVIAAIGTATDWHSLQFRRIPPIQHQVRDGKITLEVKGSAGGLVRLLPKGTRVKTLVVTGSVKGELKLDAKHLWEKGNDDAYLRVGLIVEGGRRLSQLERLMAPDWITTMDDVLGADGSAPSAIHSHLLVPHASWIGKQRANPSMKQLVDYIDATPGADGRFTMRVELPEALNLVGLWLMADGDDSGSTFTVSVESLELIAP